jgi:hypothetical protein
MVLNIIYNIKMDMCSGVVMVISCSSLSVPIPLAHFSALFYSTFSLFFLLFSVLYVSVYCLSCVVA